MQHDYYSKFFYSLSAAHANGTYNIENPTDPVVTFCSNCEVS